MRGWAWWEKAVIALVVVLLLIAAHAARAEPGNAPDVKGRFTLVGAGSMHACNNCGYSKDLLVNFAPFVVPGFLSFKLCVAAGRELQARLGTDGYVLDFACVATGRL